MLSKEQIEAVVAQYKPDYRVEINEERQEVLIYFSQCYVHFFPMENSVEIYDGIKKNWKFTYKELSKYIGEAHQSGGFCGVHQNMLLDLLSLMKTEAKEAIELTEASTEDKIHIILQSHDIEQSDEECEKTCITEDGFARIYVAGFLSVLIQAEEEVMHIGHLGTLAIEKHGFSEWDNFDSSDFPPGIGYMWWLDHLKPALFEIIELLESPDTSSELSLEKQVREILKRIGELTEVTVNHIHEDEVSFCNRYQQYWVTADKVIYTTPHGGQIEKTIPEYKADYGNYRNEFGAISALLTPKQTVPPSENEEVIQLRKQVEELQSQLERETIRRKKWEQVYENSDRRAGKLLKQNEELQGCLAEIQSKYDSLQKDHHRLMKDKGAAITNKSERIEELTEIADDYYKRLLLYQFAHEEQLRERMENRKGVTSDS